TDGRRQAGFEEPKWLGYHKIAAHYKWVLTKLLDERQYTQVLMLEDDLEVSCDFFDYFRHLTPVLHSDPTLLCVSAWNDNGQAPFVHNATVLYRTDVFPGLGWMLTSTMWKELAPKWPLAFHETPFLIIKKKRFWDDWLREKAQTKDRSCIRPEVNRVYTFGEHGSSDGQHFDRYLKPIYLNKQLVDWSAQQLDYLLHPHYDQWIDHLVQSATVIDFQALSSLPSSSSSSSSSSSEYVIWYDNIDQYLYFARQLVLIDDTKDGKPRGSYKGIVTIRLLRPQNKILFLFFLNKLKSNQLYQLFLSFYYLLEIKLKKQKNRKTRYKFTLHFIKIRLQHFLKSAPF
ncbi:mannoside acetylglucosaminyltransferase 1, partial [Reticulomyxa filosa]